MNVFATGFLQVFLISCNTYFISQGFYAGVAVMGFLISFVWSFNVRRVALGTWQDRIKYSLGAGVGSIAGLLFSKLILH